MNSSFFPNWCILMDPSGLIQRTNLPLDSWVQIHISHFLEGTENIQGEKGTTTLRWQPGKTPRFFSGNITLSASWSVTHGMVWLELVPQEENPVSLIENSYWKEFLASDLPFRQIFETNQTIKWIIDPDTGDILYVNNAACVFYGYTRDELLKLKITDINTLTRAEIFEEMKSAAAESRLYFQFKHRLKNGEIRNMEVYSGPLQFGGKRVLFSILFDVTQRVLATSRLQASEKLYRSLVENASDSIIITDMQTKISEVNQRMTELLGYTKEELQSLTLQNILDEESWEETRKKIGFLEIGKPAILSRRFKSKSGDILETEVNAVRIDENRYMGIVRDVTERNLMTRSMEKSLKEKEAMLQEIHHRVKNNLQVISSLLGMQYDNTEDPNLKKILLECENRVKSMGFVHAELYRSENLAAVDLENYFGTLVSNLIRAYGASQRVELCLDLSSLEVSLERAIPLGLILNELVTNSLKYAFPNGRTGKIRVSILQEGRCVLFSYSDDGIGFEREDCEGPDSIGMQLIEILSMQLKAGSEFTTKNGVKFSLRIPDPVLGK
ncbi:PAS domain S-box protein [Leptospira langatensis]|uniref:histidine kinase n=1 Tax=Leptospira langatensis TaxID=2484983 RepID=A0A5F1ZXB1_9LEPT|nr:PAS domain S-box protein [Leptospira langatensis]TGJ98511.1 PAS domain S-box protein [Leptospira langatensis]TGL43426.1 PAS domain S-box protein [Leptospira langatensis]